ncbi:hypothetical protein A2701_01550 [Candidatus Amesbacteria bacterium RIFCSPHIGHO2_01_FULL_47_34]|uniref:Uncharacterized protein n=1 Tax=Candidatus Amesbacteria bacterium RIFCSPLOWO2_01_FULL_47_33 TaxID=1797258 RepID=A0A1F4Z1V0_9BACT|nr:MAG: hypothetical protein A2972_01065 [Candidatus Amesbacteria bacterium RIFCSPLOWO2_01_FULL_47_33]OGD00234.1 MAG: hypothetical protein A2701_01550 [Candidatus Amesbacteria bacterium RIFCSPHIGHO2_01_FULL_47_34]
MLKNKTIEAGFSLVRFYTSGILGKYLVRGIVPWNSIEKKCLESNPESLCSLASFDSAPNAIQSFITFFGITLAMDNLLSDKISEKTILNTAGLAAIGLITATEYLQATFRNGPVNTSDIVTETLGIIPAYLIMKFYSQYK